MNSETRALVVTVLKRSGVGDRVSATPEEYRERIAELVADALEASAVSSPSDEREHMQSLAKWVGVPESASSLEIACEVSSVLENPAPPTITDDMVERAATALYTRTIECMPSLARTKMPPWDPDSAGAVDFCEDARAALAAARPPRR